MVAAEKILEIIYNFNQYAFQDFAKKLKKIPFDKNAEVHVFSILESADVLTAEEASILPDKQKKVLDELLTQYIMFLSMFPELTFPHEFLILSSERQLCAPILRYMHEHSWPFPQLKP